MDRKYKVSLEKLAMTAVLAALSIVLGKFLAIPVGNSIRISFENLPLIAASVVLGPIPGALCGLVADLLGCVLRGYAINPVITVGGTLMGLLPGLLLKLSKKDGPAYITGSVVISHVICSMIIKSAGLRWMYTTAWGVLAWRIPLYFGIAVLESVIIIVVLKNNYISRLRKRMNGIKE